MAKRMWRACKTPDTTQEPAEKAKRLIFILLKLNRPKQSSRESLSCESCSHQVCLNKAISLFQPAAMKYPLGIPAAECYRSTQHSFDDLHQPKISSSCIYSSPEHHRGHQLHVGTSRLAPRKGGRGWGALRKCKCS